MISTRRLKKKQAHNKELEEKLTCAEMQRHGSVGNDQPLGQSPPPCYAQPHAPLEMPGEVTAIEMDGERVDAWRLYLRQWEDVEHGAA